MSHEQDYDDILDSCYKEVRVAGYILRASEVLKAVKPAHYKQALAEYIAMQERSTHHE